MHPFHIYLSRVGYFLIVFKDATYVTILPIHSNCTDALRELLDKAASGIVKQFIVKSFSFSQVQQAIEFEKSNFTGKVVIANAT